MPLRSNVTVEPSAATAPVTSPPVQLAAGAEDSAPGPPPGGGVQLAAAVATAHAWIVSCDCGCACAIFNVRTGDDSPSDRVNRTAATAYGPLALEPTSSPLAGTCGA